MFSDIEALTTFEKKSLNDGVHPLSWGSQIELPNRQIQACTRAQDVPQSISSCCNSQYQDYWNFYHPFPVKINVVAFCRLEFIEISKSGLTKAYHGCHRMTTFHNLTRNSDNTLNHACTTKFFFPSFSILLADPLPQPSKAISKKLEVRGVFLTKL